MPNQSETGEHTFDATDIASAVLLAATGGLLDAIVYLDHGHVFANAMTGNVIFLALAAVERNWMQCLRHLVPIACFLMGVVGARIIRNSPGWMMRARRPALTVLALEVVGLFLIGLLPASFPQLAFTGTVAFVSAFQVATFRQVGRFTYNSTFVTGNLRMVAEGLFDRFFSSDPKLRSEGRAEAVKLGAICASFLVGALAGAIVAPRFPVHGILFAEPTLLITLILVLRSQWHADDIFLTRPSTKVTK